MKFLLFIPLLWMAYEDFRYRAIHWVWLVLLTIGILWFFPINYQLVAINFTLVVVQLILLTLYFSIKNQCLVYLPDHLLGWGDILFFIPLCFLFSPLNLLCFLIVGFIFSLLGFGLQQLTWKAAQTIPLAGYLSICLVLLIAWASIEKYNLHSDSYLLMQLQDFIF